MCCLPRCPFFIFLNSPSLFDLVSEDDTSQRDNQDDEDFMFAARGADNVNLSMLNPATWPEVIRLYLTQEDRFGILEALNRYQCMEAIERLKTMEYSMLRSDMKIAVLRVLCDEASGTNLMTKLMDQLADQNVQLRERCRKDLRQAIGVVCLLTLWCTAGSVDALTSFCGGAAA